MRYELTRRLPLPLNGRLETPLSRILEKRCNQPVFVPFRPPSFPHFLPRDGVEDDGAVSLRAYIRCAVYHRVFLFFFLFFFFSPTNYVNRGASFFRFQLRSNFLKLKQLKERRISLRFFRFVFLEKINMDISNT